MILTSLTRDMEEQEAKSGGQLCSYYYYIVIFIIIKHLLFPLCPVFPLLTENTTGGGNGEPEVLCLLHSCNIVLPYMFI